MSEEKPRSLLAEMLEEEMRLHGLSRVQMAVKLKVSDVTLGNWLRGISEPGPASKAKIAKYFNIPEDPLTALDQEESAGGLRDRVRRISRKFELRLYGRSEAELVWAENMIDALLQGATVAGNMHAEQSAEEEDATSER